MMTNFQPAELIQSLGRHQVEFVIIGGIAAAIHGLARATYDVDIVYKHTMENCDRMVSALQPFHPYLRGAPPGLPFRFDKQTLFQGCNFTLETSMGDIDLLAEIPGASSFEDVMEHSISLNAYGCQIQCVTLEKLIHLKRSAGRAKDIEMLAQLEALHREPADE